MYLQVKKIPTVKSKKKINQLPVLMPRLNGVRGDKVFFPPTKDIGHKKEFSQVQESIFPKEKLWENFVLIFFKSKTVLSIFGKYPKIVNNFSF